METIYIVNIMSPYKDRRSMSFSSDCEDAMEESSVLSTSSPPRSCRSTARKSYIPFGVNNNTPNSRRLFGEDEEEKSVNISNYRRPKIKALSNNQEYDELSLEGKPTPARKRSSADSGKTSLFYNHHGSNNPMDSSGSDESDIMMYASPRISPNSFMTMDGRFVQSKNPFSSPMMDDTPISRQQQNQIHSATGAPSLPVSFFASSDDKMSSLLPPRHNNRVPSHPSSLTGPLDTPASNIPNSQHSWYGFSGGYPDKRFSFTGSPIMEAAYEAAAMETGMASAGSLRKVRRLHLGDDVVSATTHDLSRRHNDRWQLSVNTATSDSQFSDAYLDEQGISPTDVLQFPSATPAKNSAPPPTPVKSRQNQNTYNSICRRNISTPSPPLLERRRPMPLRTPHMGQQLDESVDTESNQVDLNRDPKSRFYSDFDVIGELGEGSFGTVYKVLSRLDGCMYAIKAAQRRAKGSADRGRMLKEVSISKFSC